MELQQLHYLLIICLVIIIVLVEIREKCQAVLLVGGICQVTKTGETAVAEFQVMNMKPIMVQIGIIIILLDIPLIYRIITIYLELLAQVALELHTIICHLM